MKKNILLLLVLALVVSLFAGCAGNTGTPANTGSTPAESGSSAGTESSAGSSGSAGSTQTETTQTETTQPAETAAPAEASPYKFAAGKFAVDAKGYAAEPYEYELPISTTDEVLTMWTVCWTPEYLPEGGYEAMEYQKFLKEQTGVNVEYTVVTSDQRRENFAVLLASDDLRDIMSGAGSFYSGTLRNAIEDGWFYNLHDYRDYMPNYMYQTLSRNNPNTTSRVFYDSDIVFAFYTLYDKALPATGYCIRTDLCEKAGVDYGKIDTIGELYDAMKALKASGVPHPLEIFSTIELTPGYNFSGYNTSCCVNKYGLPYAKRDDSGKVTFSQMTEDDRALMTTLSSWYAEGLIDPNWGGNDNTTLMDSILTSDDTALCIFNPGEVSDWEARAINPDAGWDALPRFKLTEDQIIKFGQDVTDFSYGSWSISTHCQNPELAVTYCDWFYSEYGSLICSYGKPDYTWYYDDNGNIRLSDFVLHNPNGLGSAWCQVLYAINALADGGMEIQTRKFKYEGGERLEAMHYIWLVDGYKGEYDVPTAMTFTEEQDEEKNQLSNDIMTYINETYLAFLDGSSPMSEWDNYTAAAWDMGLTRCQEIYQEAFDSFMARFN